MRNVRRLSVLSLVLFAAGCSSHGGTEATAGGASAGGANVGGSSAGGANAGGANAGGANAGGSTAGGANAGGANAGGANVGGSSAGGASVGGSSAGGANAGGADVGGSSAGGANAGGGGAGGGTTGPGLLSQASYDAAMVFPNHSVVYTPTGIAWDGASFWVGGDGNLAGFTEVQYDGAGNYVASYEPGVGFSAIYTKGDGTAPVYGRQLIAWDDVHGEYIGLMDGLSSSEGCLPPGSWARTIDPASPAS